MLALIITFNVYVIYTFCCINYLILSVPKRIFSALARWLMLHEEKERDLKALHLSYLHWFEVQMVAL